MITEALYHDYGVTAACTVRLGVGTNSLPQSRSIVMGDAWFGSVKAVAATAERGMEGIYQVKTNHGLYPNMFIEDTLEDTPGGKHIAMQGNAPNGANLIVVGYRYNSKVSLCFVATRNAGSTREGEPYEMKFMDTHGNVHVRLVSRPALISSFFGKSSCVDKHNQARQYELALKKKWETCDPMFCLETTMIGLNTVDIWKLSKYNLLFSKSKMKHKAEDGMTCNLFAGILTKQLLRKADDVMRKSASSNIRTIDTLHSEDEPVSDISCISEPGATVQYYDLVKTTKGKTYRKSRRCIKVGCNMLTTTYCSCCNKAYFHATNHSRHGRKCLTKQIR